ncbi:MAG: extracellular solute-binding protein [Chloroflexota bacterium]
MSFVRALLLTSLLAGCRALSPEPTPTPTATAEPTATPTQRPVTPTPTVSPLEGRVAIWLDWAPSEMSALVGLVEAFRLEHPQVEFSLSYFPSDDLRAAFEAPPPGSAPPTLLIGPDTWGPPLSLSGRIQDVADLFAPGLRQSLQPVAVSQVEYGEVVLGLPLELQGTVLYVNRRVMPQAAPDVATLINAGALSRTMLDYGFAFTGGFLRTCNAELLDTQGDPAFTGEGGLCWLDLLRTLALAGPVVYNTDEDLERFAAGEAAWLMDGTWQRQRLIDALGADNLAIDPWPVYALRDEPLVGYVWTENVYLVQGLSRIDREANWEFARFLVSAQAQQALADPEGAAHLPVTAGVLSEDPLMNQAMAVLEGGAPYPILPETALYGQPMERSIYAVLRQGADLGLAQVRALTRIRQALAAYRASQP